MVLSTLQNDCISSMVPMVTLHHFPLKWFLLWTKILLASISFIRSFLTGSILNNIKLVLLGINSSDNLVNVSIHIFLASAVLANVLVTNFSSSSDAIAAAADTTLTETLAKYFAGCRILWNYRAVCMHVLFKRMVPDDDLKEWLGDPITSAVIESPARVTKLCCNQERRLYSIALIFRKIILLRFWRQ